MNAARHAASCRCAFRLQRAELTKDLDLSPLVAKLDTVATELQDVADEAAKLWDDQTLQLAERAFLAGVAFQLQTDGPFVAGVRSMRTAQLEFFRLRKAKQKQPGSVQRALVLALEREQVVDDLLKVR